MKRIYLDHAATTPVHPAVVDVMMHALTDAYGNPSSIHSFGREARHLLDEARNFIAASIGAKEREIVFTSGGTESDNYAIKGTVKSRKHLGKHIITTQIEHHAVLHPCEALEKEGYEVTYLPVNHEGVIAIEDLKQALRDDTILVTIMYGNNEVGTVQPIKEIGQLLSDHQAYFHTDAVQAYGVEEIDVEDLGVDLLSVSAHKINGPKGIGFLYIKQGLAISPLILGGDQELKRRSGTENLSSILAFRKAVEISQQDMKNKRDLFYYFKRIMIEEWKAESISFSINGNSDIMLPHVLNVSFPQTDVESMLINLDLAGIAASSGSACTAGSIDPSHVLVSMFGKESNKLRDSIRFSFGLHNTEADIKQAAETVASIVKKYQK